MEASDERSCFYDDVELINLPKFGIGFVFSGISADVSRLLVFWNQALMKHSSWNVGVDKLRLQI